MAVSVDVGEVEPAAAAAGKHAAVVEITVTGQLLPERLPHPGGHVEHVGLAEPRKINKVN